MHDRPMSAGEKLGVLGGMGPLATLDFLGKLVALTPGDSDQDHIPMVVHSVPEIPDRSSSFLAGSDAPWAYLLSGLYTLEGAGARAIAIPCNTAHVWYGRLAEKSRVEILHIGQAAARRVEMVAPGARRIGILATDATVRARIYHDKLEPAGITLVKPAEGAQETLVMGGIRAVKAGDVPIGASLLADAARRLVDQGADAILMACTEIPVALAGMDLERPLIDPTAALAQQCVDWWSEHYGQDRAT